MIKLYDKIIHGLGIRFGEWRHSDIYVKGKFEVGCFSDGNPYARIYDFDWVAPTVAL